MNPAAKAPTPAAAGSTRVSLVGMLSPPRGSAASSATSFAFTAAVDPKISNSSSRTDPPSSDLAPQHVRHGAPRCLEIESEPTVDGLEVRLFSAWPMALVARSSVVERAAEPGVSEARWSRPGDHALELAMASTSVWCARRPRGGPGPRAARSRGRPASGRTRRRSAARGQGDPLEGLARQVVLELAAQGGGRCAVGVAIALQRSGRPPRSARRCGGPDRGPRHPRSPPWSGRGHPRAAGAGSSKVSVEVDDQEHLVEASVLERSDDVELVLGDRRRRDEHEDGRRPRSSCAT